MNFDPESLQDSGPIHDIIESGLRLEQEIMKMGDGVLMAIEEIKKIPDELDEYTHVLQEYIDIGFSTFMEKIALLGQNIGVIFEWFILIYVFAVEMGLYTGNDCMNRLMEFIECFGSWFINIFMYPCLIPYIIWLICNLLWGIATLICRWTYTENIACNNMWSFLHGVDIMFNSDYIGFTRIPDQMGKDCFQICVDKTFPPEPVPQFPPFPASSSFSI